MDQKKRTELTWNMQAASNNGIACGTTKGVAQTLIVLSFFLWAFRVFSNDAASSRDQRPARWSRSW
ncbi:MAG: hypothetical protein AABZ10_04415 [Nitrospirota bacterium]